MIFNTERLVVRPLRTSDLEPYFELHGNINVMRYTTGKKQTFEESETDLNRVIDYYSSKPTFRVWAIETKADNVFIGTCALIVNDKNDNEIGYRFLEKHWGNGYGMETTQGLIRYCFENLKLPSIYAEADVLNIGSIKILETTMNFVKEYYIKEEDCTAREYRLTNKFLEK